MSLQISDFCYVYPNKIKNRFDLMKFNSMGWGALVSVLTLGVCGQSLATELFLSDIKMPPETENVYVHKLAEDESASDFVVFVKKRVPPHKHMTHTETVYVLEGTGIFEMGGKKIKIAPGHYVKIPKGVVHSVTVTSKIPLKALSIQAPQFFGKDRVWVKGDS